MSPIIPVGAQITGDASGFVGAMGTAIRGLTSFAGAAGLATTAMGAFAGAIALGAAIGAARDFQVELVKLNTLVGIQTEQIEAWEGSLKDLAVETGQAPTDLAKAMFAITSGGARGADALEILTAAAKASAIGLGDMTALGRTAGAMLQAFGDRGLTAEKAIDVLTATVRAGNLEADSLAGAFSRVLGPAAALGSSVEDIGAFMATFTRLGGDTANAATGLLNIFTLMIKPPEEARVEMEKLGISLEDIRTTIREDGLTDALLEMQEALGDNVDALGRVLPNVRGLIAFLSTAGLQGEAFAQIQREIDDSLGLTEAGFITWGKSADAAFKQFSAQAQVIGIEVGSNLLPPLAALLRLMIPLSEIIRKSAEGWDLLFQAMSDDEGLLKTLGRFFGIIDDSAQAAALAVERLDASVGVMNLDQLKEASTEAKNNVVDLQERIEELQADLAETTPDQSITPFVAEMRNELNRLTPELETAKASLLTINDAIRAGVDVTEDLTAAEEALEEALAQVTEADIERQKAIEAIIAGLEQEVRVLREGEFANVEYRLEQEKATDADIERARVQFDLAQMLRDTADAEREAEQEAERARRNKEREDEREEQRLAKAVKDAEDAARTLAENTALAEVQDRMRLITDESRQMAESIGQAFSDISDGTKSVGEAFGDMVTEILKQLQRLIIQETIIRPLLGFLVSQLAPGTDVNLGSNIQTSTSAIPGDVGLVRGSHKPGHFVVPGGLTTEGQGAGLVQNITFAPTLIDGASGQRFIEQNAGVITGIIAEGARNSGQLSSAFAGENQ